MSKSRKKTSVRSFGSMPWAAGLIVALFFGVPGICLTIAAAVSNYSVVEQMNWVKTDAKPFAHAALDSASWDDISYNYTVGSNEYLGSGKNSVNDETLFNFVKDAISHKSTIYCWYNPANHHESCLNPATPNLNNMFFGIFGISHGLTGILLFHLMVKAKIKDKANARLRVQHPDEPYRWRSDWVNNQSENTQFDTRFCYLYTFIVCMITQVWTAITTVLVDHADQALAVSISFVTIIPIVLFFRAWRTQRINKGLTIHFEQPLKIGQTAYLKLADRNGLLPKLAVADGMKFHLTNKETISVSDGSQSQTICETNATVVNQSFSEINLTATIPLEGEPSSFEPDDADNRIWKLQGKRKKLKIGPFELPVLPADPNSELAIEQINCLEERFASDGITITNQTDELIIQFEKNRNPELIQGMLVIGIALLIFGIIPGVIMLFYRWLLINRTFEIKSSANRLTYIINGKLRTRELVFTPDNVEEIEINSDLSINSQAFSRIMIRKPNQIKIAISPLFSNRKLCKLVANSLLIDVKK